MHEHLSATPRAGTIGPIRREIVFEPLPEPAAPVELPVPVPPPAEDPSPDPVRPREPVETSS